MRFGETIFSGIDPTTILPSLLREVFDDAQSLYIKPVMLLREVGESYRNSFGASSTR